MKEAIINNKAQQRLANPLMQKDFITKPNEKLRIRMLAHSKNSSVSARALLCRIIFLDAESKPIESNYEGAFFSTTYGNYLYIPSIPKSEKAEWLKRTITAPKNARTVRLIVLEGESRINNLEPLKHIDCISGALPLVETILPITAQLPNKLSLYFSKKIDGLKAALVSIVYFDKNESVILGPHLNLAFSTRYGYFKYIHRTNEANIFELCLLPPDSAVSIQLRVYSLQNTGDLELKRSPKLDVYSIYKELINSDNWERIAPEKTIRLTIPSCHSSGEVLVLPLHYVSYSESHTFDVSIQSCGDNPSFHNHEKPLVLPSSNHNQHIEALHIFVPEKATSINLTFKHSHQDIVYLKKNTTLNKVTGNCTSYKSVSKVDHEVFFDISSLWKPLLLISKPDNTKSPVIAESLEMLITFYNKSNTPLSVVPLHLHQDIFGNIIQSDSTTLKLLPDTHSIANGICRASVISASLFHPPEESSRLGVKILGNSQTSHASCIELKLTQFEVLIQERVTEGTSAIFLTDLKWPWAATMPLLACLTKKFPNAPVVLDQALEIYRAYGDLSESNKLSIHILNNIKNAIIRNKARLLLAEQESMNPNWSPSLARTIIKNTKAENQTSNLIVAMLLGPDQEQIPTTSFQQQDQNTRIFCVTPLGYPGPGTSGDPWERESLNKTAYYRLNCVSLKDLATVPVTTQIEFSSLLMAKILELEETNIIHAVISSKAYQTAIISMTLAKALNLPLILELLDSEIFDSSLQTESTEYSRSVYQTIFRCVQNADALIISSEIKSKSVFPQHIDEDRIFIAPLTESKKRDVRNSNPHMFMNKTSSYVDVYQYVLSKPLDN